MKLLDDLYYGRISPWEESFSHSPEYRICEHKLSACQQQLDELLSTLPNPEHAHKLLNQLLALHTELGGFDQEAFFMYGFQLGAGLLAEAAFLN